MGSIISCCDTSKEDEYIYIPLATNAPYFDRPKKNAINYEMLCAYYR
jgi:hypothetical protein